MASSRSQCSCTNSAGILPKTDVWDGWKREVVAQEQVDPKKLYVAIDEKAREARPGRKELYERSQSDLLR